VAHNKYRALGPRTPEDLLLWTGSERRSGRPETPGCGGGDLPPNVRRWGGANECLIKAERMRGAGPGLLGPGGPGESAVPDARATAVLVCTVAVAELVGWV
jgi:hypothetical protein